MRVRTEVKVAYWLLVVFTVLCVTLVHAAVTVDNKLNNPFASAGTVVGIPVQATVLSATSDVPATMTIGSNASAMAAISPYAYGIISNWLDTNPETANIGLFVSSQATLNDAARFGYGIYGHGYTNGSTRSGGVVGEGMVTNTADTGAAMGLRGYSVQPHAGGLNVGLYGESSGGASNYDLYLLYGSIYSPSGTIAVSGAITATGAITSSGTIQGTALIGRRYGITAVGRAYTASAATTATINASIDLTTVQNSATCAITLAAPLGDGEIRRVVFTGAGSVTWTVTAPATTISAQAPTTVTAGQEVKFIYQSVAGSPANAPATAWLIY